MSTQTYTLDQYKTDAEKNLRLERDRKKQVADIERQKLLKYLPVQQRAAGTSGMAGLSESARLAAASNYQNQVAAAESEYGAAQTELLNNYRLEKKAEQDELYDEVMTKIDSGEFNTTDELNKYLYGEDGKSGITQGLSEQQKKLVQGKSEYYANNPDQLEADKEKKYQQEMNAAGIKVSSGATVNGMNGTKKGQNFTVTLSDESYYVEIGDKLDENSDTLKKANGVPVGQLFAKDGKVFYKASATECYEINGVGGNKTNGDFANLKRILEAGKSEQKKE